MPCVFLSGFRKLCRFLAIDFRAPWGPTPRAVGLVWACVAFAASPNARAEERVLGATAPSTHIALGPQLAAIRVNADWDTGAGGELHIARLRESDALSVFGAAFGVAGYSKGEALQLSLDFYAGSKALGQVPIGLSIGPLLKAFPNGRPQVGGRTTLWVYHGVMPFLSVSWLSGPMSPAQPGLEIGVKIPFSIWDW